MNCEFRFTIKYFIAVLTWGFLVLFLPKSLTSVAEVRLFIALYEKNHLCQGKTIELISILCHSFFNVLDMHGVDTVIVIIRKDSRVLG